MVEYQKIINSLLQQRDLRQAEVAQLFNQVLQGNMPDAQLAAVLTAWAIKGSTSDELFGLTKVVLKLAVPFKVKGQKKLLDVVGTGGDKSGTFNVSTISAIVCAAAGVPVAKHGNRAATSKCGSFDFLEQAKIFSPNDSPKKAYQTFQQLGIAFLFARNYHPALKYVVNVRKELSFPTIFNIIGPLVNPARPKNLLIGVARPELADLMGKTAIALGAERVVLVHGKPGIDEVSVTGTTQVTEFKRSGKTKTYQITPTQLGLKKHSLSKLKGRDAVENVRIAQAIFKNNATEAQRDFVLANSGVALYTAGAVKTIPAGVTLARATIQQGKALRLYQALQKF